MTDVIATTPELPLLRSFADVEKVLADTLPGYEVRPGQQKFAAAVERAIANEDIERAAHRNPEGDLTDEYIPQHLLAQAGCGVGKSLSYLIPAILSGKSVVVSVTTKALQDQLAYKDVPFLQEHLPDFTWAVLKGRSNYLCLTLAYSVEDNTKVPHRAQIAEYAKAHPEFDGLRESLPFEVEDSEWWNLHADTDGCSDADCSKEEPTEDGWQCFAAKARREAANAQLVIANHSLICVDLGIGGFIFGDRELVIFDEAHALEQIAADCIGYRLSESTFTALGNNLRSFTHAHGEGDSDALDTQVAVLTAAATELFAQLSAIPSLTREPSLRLKDAQLLEHGDYFLAVIDALARLQAIWKATSFDTRGQKGLSTRKYRLTNQLNNALSRTQEVLIAEQTDRVRWIEVEKVRHTGTRTVVKCAPVSVANYLAERLWNRVATVSCSATLKVQGDFTFIANRLGIPAALTLEVESPFDFATQAKLYVPDHLPAPKGGATAAFEAGAIEEIIDLIKASRGRALVLFTSTKQMKSTAEAIRHRDRIKPYQLLVQGDASNKELAERFTADTHSVLFGLKSFFTGVDFQGETLSLLIIVKLPFAVPTEPMTEARSERLEREGKSAFRDYALPVMSLDICQAAGRLIRHTNDTGIVAILDPRITNTPYGKTILRDLPPFPLTRKFSDVEAFFAG